MNKAWIMFKFWKIIETVINLCQLVLLNKNRSYTDASIARVNGCIACICSWLLVIYIVDVG